MTWSPRFRPTGGTPTSITTPSPGVPGRSVSQWGAFLDDVARLRFRVLRDQRAGGHCDRPAASLAAGNLMGGHGARRFHPGEDRRLADRCVRGIDAWRLPPAGSRCALRGGAVRVHRHEFQHGVRADRLCPGGPRSRAHGRLGMLFWPDRGAYGLPQPARRRKRPCLRRRRQRDVGPAEVLRGLGAGHAVADGALPCVRRRGGRVRARRGLRRGVAQAVVGCATRR